MRKVKVNRLQIAAKKEYLIIKTLQLSLVAIAIALIIYFFSQYSFSGMFQLSAVLKNTSMIYGSIFFLMGALLGVIIWRIHRISSSIEAELTPYFKNLGCTIKKTIFHTFIVFLSSEVFFKIKIILYRRASDEECLFNLISMPLTTLNETLFNKIGELFFLKPNLKSKTYSTSCEFPEIHSRSLLLINALNKVQKVPN